MHDDELDKLMRTAAIRPPDFPAAFQRDVWLRITVAEQQRLRSGWRAVTDALCQWLARPVPATVTVMGMLLAGMGFGHLAVRSDEAPMRAAYLQSINPIAAAHTSAHQ